MVGFNRLRVSSGVGLAFQRQREPFLGGALRYDPDFLGDLPGVEVQQQLPRKRFHLPSFHLHRHVAPVPEDPQLGQRRRDFRQLLLESLHRPA